MHLPHEDLGSFSSKLHFQNWPRIFHTSRMNPPIAAVLNLETKDRSLFFVGRYRSTLKMQAGIPAYRKQRLLLDL